MPARKIKRSPPADSGTTPAPSYPLMPSEDPLRGKIVVRLKEAFELIGCKPAKGYELLKQGRLKAIKVDGMTLVYVSLIRQLLGLAP